MSKRGLVGALSALALAALGAVAAAALPASAGTAEKKICPTWSLRSGGLVEQTWTWFVAPAAGSKMNNTEVTLTKPDAELGGTEFASKNVAYTASSEDITVKYALHDGASFAAGAVRLFFYHAQNANTETTAPDGVAIADALAGTLKIDNVVGTVGTLGVVYDGSNTAGGNVTFEDMKIGDTKVKFQDVCTPPTTAPTATPTITSSPSPSLSPSASPSASSSMSSSASPSASSSASPTATSSVSAAPTQTTEAPVPARNTGGDGGSLAKTGTPTLLIAGGGLALLFVGGALLVATQRRRKVLNAELTDTAVIPTVR